MMKSDSLVTVVLYDYGVRDVMGDQLQYSGYNIGKLHFYKYRRAYFR
jgi:hypothetical protein